jgi:hypothetical protein
MSETVAGWTIAFSWNKITVKSVGTEITLTARGNGKPFTFNQTERNSMGETKRTLRFTGKKYILVVSKVEGENEQCSLTLTQVSDTKPIVEITNVPVEVFTFFEDKATGSKKSARSLSTLLTNNASALSPALNTSINNTGSANTVSGLMPPNNNINEQISLLPEAASANTVSGLSNTNNSATNENISLSKPNQNNELENVSPNEMRSLRPLNANRNNDRFRGGKRTRRRGKGRSTATRNRRR